MLLLLDTSTRTAVVALADDAGSLLGEHTYPPGGGGSALLLEGACTLLEDAGSGLDALTGIVLNKGPGSYTGLRVGYALAQGLAASRDLPVVTIPSFEALALELRKGTSTFVVCYDAKTRGMAWITYPKGEAGPLVVPEKGAKSKGITERIVLDPGRIALHLSPAAALPGLVSRPCVVSGPGVGVLMKMADGPLPDDLEIVEDSERPSPGVLLSMGAARLAEGAVDLADMEPYYLGTIASPRRSAR
jgi:tRNA threonylcarbamoyl adenosine modification protein YeaZ